MVSYRLTDDDPLYRRPLTELARKERALLRMTESPIEQHRRLGQEMVNTFEGLLHLLLDWGRRLAH